MLAPLSDGQRDHLVAAMAQVQKLLTASMVEIEAVDPDHAHARFCMREYFSELDHRFGSGFDPEGSMPADADDLRPPAGTVPGRHAPRRTGRLWRAEVPRRRADRAEAHVGLARRCAVSAWDAVCSNSWSAGPSSTAASVIHLETNKALPEAVAMYRSCGYREVDAFNDEPYADHWFEKVLD